MKDSFQVAVVMPCYNAQATLPETLESIAAQTFEDFCLVAVNDGSQDQTADILESFAQRFPERVVVIDQENQGQTVAKNVGLERSRSDFVAFIDSDDLWAPDKLEKQVRLMADNPQIGLCYTAARQIDPESTPVGLISVSPSHRGRCLNELILRNNIVASSVMVRRDAVEQAGGFDTALRACENWDLWIRIARGYELEYLDEPLTSYRLHPNNMSKNFEKIFNARLQVIDKHLPECSDDDWTRDQRRMALYRTHLTFAKSYIESLRLVEARRELTEAMKIRRTEAECYLLYLKTLLRPGVFRLARSLRGGQ